METEIKIEVADFEPIREQLRALGAKQLSVVDEENIYLDRDGELARRNDSLRVRFDGRTRITWKGPTEFREGVIVRPEIEFAIISRSESPTAEVVDLLDKLGFRPVGNLTKKRETWHLNGIEIALDTLDFGQFVELEGPVEVISPVASALGLDLSQSLRDSYRKLRRERSAQAFNS